MRRMFSMLFALALLLAFSLVATTPVAAATTWYVDDDNCPGPGTGTSSDPFCTIQAAMAAAASDDTIMVAAGTYYEQLIIDKGITLDGSGADTVIDGGDPGKAMQFRSPGPGVLSGVRIVDLTLTGQSGAVFDGAWWPEELSVEGVEFDNCVFNATGYSSIGISNGAQVTDITIRNSVFQASVNTQNAIAIHSGYGGNTTVNNLRIVGGTINVAAGSQSQGLFVFNGATVNGLSIEGVTFNNPSRSAIMFQDCTINDAVIMNSELIGDTSYGTTGYGIYMGSSVAPAVISNFLVSNVTFLNQKESAIIAFRWFEISGLTIRDCLFDTNRGHITFYRLAGGSGTVSDILIENNTFLDLLNWHSIWISNANGGVSFSADDIVVRYNNFISGGSAINNAVGVSVDATYNWWGADDGPSGAGPGSGDTVSANVLFVPWACQPTTGGLAYLTPSAGVIDDLTPVPPPPGAPVSLPYGMFSFNVTGLTPGGSVTITVELPGAVPVGTKWWKYQGGSWYSLPIGDDDGDNIITITLTDGVFPGDGDGVVNGQITDPGGPGSGTVPTSSAVPSVSQWGAIGIGIALAAMLVWKLRKRTASF